MKWLTNKKKQQQKKEFKNKTIDLGQQQIYLLKNITKNLYE